MIEENVKTSTKFLANVLLKCFLRTRYAKKVRSSLSGSRKASVYAITNVNKQASSSAIQKKWKRKRQ